MAKAALCICEKWVWNVVLWNETCKYLLCFAS